MVDYGRKLIDVSDLILFLSLGSLAINYFTCEFFQNVGVPHCTVQYTVQCVGLFAGQVSEVLVSHL